MWGLLRFTPDTTQRVTTSSDQRQLWLIIIIVLLVNVQLHLE